MKFIILVKASKESEAGQMPTRAQLEEMGKFNEGLAKDGVLLDGQGLRPTSKASRLRFDGGRVTVIDGPFAETKEQLLGFYILDVENLEAALDAARQIAAVNPGGAFEIRPIAVFNPDERSGVAVKI